MTTGIFDDLLGLAARAPDATIRIAAIQAAADGPPSPRVHLCARCCRLRTEDERFGQALSPIERCSLYSVQIDAEVKKVYASGLCRGCRDVEWSERWTLQYEKASKAGNASAMRELTAAANAWVKLGRKFFGKTATKGPPTP